MGMLTPSAMGKVEFEDGGGGTRGVVVAVAVEEADKDVVIAARVEAVEEADDDVVVEEVGEMVLVITMLVILKRLVKATSEDDVLARRPNPMESESLA